MKHIKYLKYVLRHRWFVFLECTKEDHFWLGLLHDWSKLLPSEFFPYAEHFYGKGKDITSGRDKTGYYRVGDSSDSKFNFAWLLHQKRNKHHWQWWILPMDDGTTKVFDMPVKYMIEMICDWRGAGRAQGNKTAVVEWYEKNKDKMTLSSSTRSWIEFELLSPSILKDTEKF